MTTASQTQRPRRKRIAPPRVPQSAATVVITNIAPCLDCGASPIKRVIGQEVVVEADVFKDGHEELAVLLEWRRPGGDWESTSMTPLGNDRWRGEFRVAHPGWMEYRVTAWGELFVSWAHEMRVKTQAGWTNLESEILEGAALVEAAAGRADGADAERLADFVGRLRGADAATICDIASSEALQALMERHSDRSLATSSAPLRIWVDRPRAGFASWYEFFPRSAGGHSDRGSTFRECLPRIDDARAMGFDVIYFPPIHPIGATHRKGRNNALTCEPGDPGVPYAIGNRAQGVNGGGHKDVAPELGTLEDFDWLVQEIRARDMEIALDFAINCSPDHPWVRDHPEWFFKRPDGSIKFAENPPKKYEDVYPLNFHNPEWRALWRELRGVLAFWCARGVRIFRVDNPHTKPVAFWEWVIADIQREYPEVIFLSEAFTRPKMMQALAKAGFTQSYTYFTWRNTKAELTEYLTELTSSEMREYFRPNFFTNTPDILPWFLQTGGRPAFCIRAILAATLSPVYGIYSGFELCENAPVPGREEYLDSEKYHFKGRDWEAPGNIKSLITRLNAIRAVNPALQSLCNLHFLRAENDQILFFAKTDSTSGAVLLVAVTLDPHNPQTTFVDIPAEAFGMARNEPCSVEDLLTGETFPWVAGRNYVALDPRERPAHIFRLHRRPETTLGIPKP